MRSKTLPIADQGSDQGGTGAGQYREYPFMIGCFNLTKKCMEAAREGGIEDINGGTFSIDKANDYYCAMLRRLDERWREEKLTLLQFNSTLDEIIEESKK